MTDWIPPKSKSELRRWCKEGSLFIIHPFTKERIKLIYPFEIHIEKGASVTFKRGRRYLKVIAV